MITLVQQIGTVDCRLAILLVNLFGFHQRRSCFCKIAELIVPPINSEERNEPLKSDKFLVSLITQAL